MMDIEKVIKGLENCSVTNGNCQWKEHPDCPYIERCKAKDYSALNRDALKLLKKQKEEIDLLRQMCQSMMEGIVITTSNKKNKTVNTWHHLWDAPDGSFKARCGNCGFVHFFVEEHDSQYRFCPQCGEQKCEL